MGAPRARVAVVAVAALLLGAGCVREAAKEAAQGTMQALVEPKQEGKEQGEQRSARGERSGTGAGAGATQPNSIVGDAIEGSVTALDKEMGTVQRVTRGTAAAAVGGAMTGALQQREEMVELVAESAGAAGRAFAREAVAELTAPLPGAEGTGEGMGEGQGQPGGAIALLARQGAAAAVGGAADGLQAALTACPSGDANCAYGVLQQASRAIAVGAAEGVERAVDVWHIVLAFLGGVVLAGIFALLFRAAMIRRPPPGSEGTGTPPRGFFGGLRGSHEAVAGASAARMASVRMGALHRHAATRTARSGRRPRVQRPLTAS